MSYQQLLNTYLFEKTDLSPDQIQDNLESRAEQEFLESLPGYKNRDDVAFQQCVKSVLAETGKYSASCPVASITIEQLGDEGYLVTEQADDALCALFPDAINKDVNCWTLAVKDLDSILEHLGAKYSPEALVYVQAKSVYMGHILRRVCVRHAPCTFGQGTVITVTEYGNGVASYNTKGSMVTITPHNDGYKVLISTKNPLFGTRIKEPEFAESTSFWCGTKLSHSEYKQCLADYKSGIGRDGTFGRIYSVVSSVFKNYV